jgi:hypothetical protein
MLHAFVNHKGTNFNDDQDFIRAIWNAIPFNLQFVRECKPSNSGNCYLTSNNNDNDNCLTKFNLQYTNSGVLGNPP